MRTKFKILKSYAIKSSLLILAIFAISKVLPLMAAIPVACVWVAMSLFSTFGLMYQVVIRKTHRQYKFLKKGKLATLNNGRMVSFTLSFIISAACIASLLVESPSWNIAQWLLVVFSAPLFIVISLLVEIPVKKELKPTFQKAYVITITAVITGILLCLAYLALSLVSAEENYDTLLQALLMIPNDFSNSPSAILKDVGVLKWAGETWSNYYISEAGSISHYVYSILKVVVYAGALFGVANLLGVCSLNLGDIKRTVQELPNRENDTSLKVPKRFVAVSIIVPIAFSCGFIYVDNFYGHIRSTSEYSWVENQMRAITSHAILVKDGAYYDKEKVIKLLGDIDSGQAETTRNTLIKQAKELKDSINDAYDETSNRTEDFLNWYYSLPTNPSELSDFTEDNTQTQLSEKFCEKAIKDYGSHNFDLNSNIKAYIKTLDSYVDDMFAKLENCKVEQIPSWLVVPENVEELPSNNWTYAFLIQAQQAQEKAQKLGIADQETKDIDIFSNRICEATSETSSYQKIESKIKDIVTRMKNSLNIVNVLDVQLIDQLANRQTYKNDLQNAIKDDKDKILEILVQ